METVTRVYDSYGQARQAVADLESAGVASSDINLIANKYVCDETSNLDERTSGAGPGAGIGAALGLGASLPRFLRETRLIDRSLPRLRLVMAGRM